MAAQYCPWRAKSYHHMRKLLFIVWNNFMTFAKSNFTFTVHVRSCQTALTGLQTQNIAYKPPSKSTKKLKSCTCAAALYITLLPRQAVGLGAPRMIIRCVCHHGHFKALSRCRLVGSCVHPGENLFTSAYGHVCTFGTVTGNLAVNSVFVTIRSMKDTNKLHFLFSFSKLFLPFP